MIWVIGAHKVVRDLDEGLRRVREYVFPLADVRVRGDRSRQPGQQVAIIHGEVSGRASAILVKEPLGF